MVRALLNMWWANRDSCVVMTMNAVEPNRMWKALINN